jgi:hypothetical protein
MKGSRLRSEYYTKYTNKGYLPEPEIPYMYCPPCLVRDVLGLLPFRGVPSESENLMLILTKPFELVPYDPDCIFSVAKFSAVLAPCNTG